MGQKIVHVINDFPSKSETFIVNHIVETIKEGIEPHILVNNLGPKEATSQLHLFDKYSLYEIATPFNNKIPSNRVLRLFKAILILLSNILYAPVFFRTLKAKKYGAKSKSLKMWFQAAVFIKYRKIELFHGHFAISGQLLAEMKEIGAIKGKIITTFYGYDTFTTKENREDIKLAYEKLFKYSDIIVTSSKYLANNLKLIDAPLEKLIVNPVGVDVDKFKYLERTIEKPLNLVTLGRLIKLKGQHIGIKAVKILIDRGHNVIYTIVGSGEELANLKHLISKLNIEKYVVLKDSKSQNEVIEILSSSNLFLMTSITDEFGRAEGQGLVTAEAQSMGIPAIGFNCGGVPETIIHNKTGLIVDETHEIGLANAIEIFLSDPKLIIEMGKNASAMVKRDFNSRLQSKKIIELYNIN